MFKIARWIGPRAVFYGIGLVLALLPIGCSQGCQQNPYQTNASTGAPIVRVLVRENAPQATLSATEQPTVRTSGMTQRINLTRGATVNVILGSNGWHIGSAAVGSGELTVIPAAAGTVKIDGHAYRGRLRFVPAAAAGRFDVINDVDVDGYLMSVVPGEMFPQWNPQAYRAQAIVARTYALYVSHTAPSTGHFDLYADTRSQMYGGMSSETAKSREAIEATRGVVLVYGPAGQERVFKAYFSSCCGGVRQSAADAFGDPPIAPLSAQNIGPRCAESTHFNWPAVTIQKAELTRRLRLWGAANNHPMRTMADVNRIDIESNNVFGRPRRFAVTDARGVRFSLASEDFRHAVNTDAADHVTLASSFCKPLNDPSQVRFTEGHGFGHGVGLCQWCAEHDANAGIRHELIVLNAFPGAKLLRVY